MMAKSGTVLSASERMSAGGTAPRTSSEASVSEGPCAEVQLAAAT